MPYLSASALASLIKDFEDQGIPELSQRKHIQEAKKVAVIKHHAYGPLIGYIPMVYNDGSSKNMLVVNFLSWLQAAFGQGGSLTQLVKEKHAANPSSPSNSWKLLMYSDEVVPGNPLGHTQARKIQVVYCAFHEYGPFHLSKEIAWHCVFIKRSNDVLNIDGGMSQVMAGLVKHIFCNPLCNVSEVGLLLKDDQGQHLRFFFELGGFVQDGMAQKSVFPSSHYKDPY